MPLNQIIEGILFQFCFFIGVSAHNFLALPVLSDL